MRLYPFRALIPRLASLRTSEDLFPSGPGSAGQRWGKGFFQPVAHPDLYVYRIRQAHRRFLGLVAATDIRDYIQGAIRIHEKTLPAREEVQRQLLERRKLSIKPVLFTYPAVEGLDEGLAAVTQKSRPVARLKWNDEVHELWSLAREGQAMEIAARFEREVPHAYLADGHHRSSCQARLFREWEDKSAQNPFRHLFTAYFSSQQIQIHAFNRIAWIEDARLAEQLWQRLQDLATVEPMAGSRLPLRKHELTLYWRGAWFDLRWKAELLRQFRHQPVVFDCQLLDVEVLKKNLPPGGWKVKYVEAPRGLDFLAQETGREPSAMAFCLPAVPLEDLMAMADQGRALPPKSTWFEPRMRNGVMGMPLWEENGGG